MIVTAPPTADPVSKMLTASAVSLVIKSGSLISIFPPVLTEPLPVRVPAPVNIEASVIDIAVDCDKQFRHLRFGNIDNNKIVVDRTMIQEVTLRDKTHYMILENYVVGVYRRPDEN